jgi:Fe-S-cluster containining protein
MINEKSILDSFSLLEDVYKKIPQTKGCESAHKTCRSWCCKYQTPSMFYVEFLYFWNNFIKNSKKEDILKVIYLSIKNFLSNNVTKTCVLFDNEKYNCSDHKHRPFCCRVYGIVHPHKWEKRVKSVKEQNLNVSEKNKANLSKVLKQCDLVKCKNGKNHISEKDEDILFGEVEKAEIALGIPENIVRLYDHPKGSFRAIHDHIMVNIFSNDVLEKLSNLRRDDITEKEIDELTSKLMMSFSNDLPSSGSKK